MSISASGGGALEVTSGTEKTNQNVSMMGADENYPQTAVMMLRMDAILLPTMLLMHVM